MADPQLIHWICSVPVGILISIIGLIGNFISIVVWKRIINSKLRGNPSTGIYLIALAICDSGLLIMFLLTDSLPMDHSEIKETYSYSAFFSWVGFPLFFMFLTASIWMVAGIALNRFVMVQFPTKVRDIYTTKNTLIGIAAVIIFSILINIPHFFVYYPKEGINGSVMLSYTTFGISEEAKNYEFWAHCIFVVLAPWFTIAILNGLIIYKLNQQMKKFTNLAKEDKKGPKSKQEQQERQMTIMLLTVTISFLVLLAWQCITQCFWMLEYGKTPKDQNSSTWQIVDTAFAFAKLGVIINSSINWFFYCITSTMFRNEMRKIVSKVKHNYSATFSTSAGTGSIMKDVIIVNSNA